ncbi:hypothetical protein [Pedobacter agri]|uniref:hypothetical protein n=1 Tax=Pedobacter agri TaxID=454586 RepID=UPI000E232020|nr:hypothetical protein [Pedobacter agri]MDQ1142646.1 hypothetical protein [Pedobacter agri]
MRSNYTSGLEESKNTRTVSLKSKSRIKVVRIGRHSTLSDLANIKLGTYIKNDEGLKGKVLQIDIVEVRYERHYYFRLEKGAGTILIIK